MEIELVAKFKAWFDDVTSELRANRRAMAKMAMQPALFTIPMSKTAPAASFVISGQSGQNQPPQGTTWYIRNIIVADTALAIDAANAAGVFVLVTAASLDSATGTTVPIEAIRDNMTPTTGTSFSNPIVKQYSNEQLVVHENEEISILIMGGTTGHQYTVSINGVAVQNSAMAQEWAI